MLFVLKRRPCTFLLRTSKPYAEVVDMGCVGIVGSRSLLNNFRFHIREVVTQLLAQDCHINSGGAMGADSYVVKALLRHGKSFRGVIYSAWSYFSGFPYSVRQDIGAFAKKGGRIDFFAIRWPQNCIEISAASLVVRLNYSRLAHKTLQSNFLFDEHQKIAYNSFCSK